MARTTEPKSGLAKPDDPAVRAARISGRHTVAAAMITGLVTALVGLAGVVVAFQTGKNKGAEAAPTVTVTVQGSGSPSTSGSTAGSTPAVVSASFEVHLNPETGVDVDAGTARDGVAAQGPTGALDVYFDSQLIRVNGGKMYVDHGTDVGAEERCRAVTKSTSGAQPPSTAWQNDKYCFLTSDGNPAWMYVNGASVNGPSKYVDLKVFVWR